MYTLQNYLPEQQLFESALIIVYSHFQVQEQVLLVPFNSFSWMFSKFKVDSQLAS